MPLPTDNKFRSKLIRHKNTGGGMLVHPCVKCGDGNAPFGINKKPEENKGKKTDNYPIINWQFIEWFCQKCKPEEL